MVASSIAKNELDIILPSLLITYKFKLSQTTHSGLLTTYLLWIHHISSHSEGEREYLLIGHNVFIVYCIHWTPHSFISYGWNKKFTTINDIITEIVSSSSGAIQKLSVTCAVRMDNNLGKIQHEIGFAWITTLNAHFHELQSVNRFDLWSNFHATKMSNLSVLVFIIVIGIFNWTVKVSIVGFFSSQLLGKRYQCLVNFWTET